MGEDKTMCLFHEEPCSVLFDVGEKSVCLFYPKRWTFQCINERTPSPRGSHRHPHRRLWFLSKYHPHNPLHLLLSWCSIHINSVTCGGSEIIAQTFFLLPTSLECIYSAGFVNSRVLCCLGLQRTCLSRDSRKTYPCPPTPLHPLFVCAS